MQEVEAEAGAIPHQAGKGGHMAPALPKPQHAAEQLYMREDDPTKQPVKGEEAALAVAAKVVAVVVAVRRLPWRLYGEMRPIAFCSKQWAQYRPALLIGFPPRRCQT